MLLHLINIIELSLAGGRRSAADSDLGCRAAAYGRWGTFTKTIQKRTLYMYFNTAAVLYLFEV